MKKFYKYFSWASEKALRDTFSFFGFTWSTVLLSLAALYGIYNYSQAFGLATAKDEFFKFIWGVLEPTLIVFLTMYFISVLRNSIPARLTRDQKTASESLSILFRILGFLLFTLLIIGAAILGFIGYRRTIAESNFFIPPEIVTVTLTPSTTPTLTSTVTATPLPTLTATPSVTPTATPWGVEDFLDGELNNAIWDSSSCGAPNIRVYVGYVYFFVDHHKLNQCWLNMHMSSAHDIKSVSVDFVWEEGVTGDGWLGIHTSCGEEKFLFIFDDRSVGYKRDNVDGWTEIGVFDLERPVPITLSVTWTDDQEIELLALSTQANSVIGKATIPCASPAIFFQIGSFLQIRNFDLYGRVVHVEVVDK